MILLPACYRIMETVVNDSRDFILNEQDIVWCMSYMATCKD
jgi:hypothetical protein